MEEGTCPLSVTSADLNGDSILDVVLVIENQKVTSASAEIGQRQLLILTGQPDGVLRKAKTNNRIVYCSTCGGIMGDPFVGVQAGPKTFTVSHYGGSAWRWEVDYKFDFVPDNTTWRLVRVEERSFHASQPAEVKTKIFISPKDFGKIDIQNFDPEGWKKESRP